MIVAGIDEAGLGPLLGPLCLGSSAVEVPTGQADTPEHLPDLWRLLGDAVSSTRDRSGRRLHVSDSKKVFAGRADAGRVALERGVLAFQAATGAAVPTSLDDVHEALSLKPTEVPRWYAPAESERHPLWTSSDNVAIAANVLRHAVQGAGCRVVSLQSRLLFEPEYNRLCVATRNKSAVVQVALAELLYDLLERHASSPGGLSVVVDRQGGRSRYGPFLRQMFEEWSLEVIREADGESAYVLRRGTGVARIVFAEKAESLCLPTALASMIAKYLRERYMERFNAFFQSVDSGLKPTAGYWSDAQRFLKDAEGAMDARGVERVEVERER